MQPKNIKQNKIQTIFGQFFKIQIINNKYNLLINIKEKKVRADSFITTN